MSRCLLCLVVLLSVSSKAYSALWFGYECPDGHKAGDVWYTGRCGKCTCHEDYYRCESCGVFAYDETQCYSEGYPEETYPDCCFPILRCRGEEGFDESKLIQS